MMKEMERMLMKMRWKNRSTRVLDYDDDDDNIVAIISLFLFQSLYFIFNV